MVLRLLLLLGCLGWVCAFDTLSSSEAHFELKLIGGLARERQGGSRARRRDLGRLKTDPCESHKKQPAR